MPTRRRVARSVTDLAKTISMFRLGLGLEVIWRLENQGGFDGAMLGHADDDFQPEFAFCREHPLRPSPINLRTNW